MGGYGQDSVLTPLLIKEELYGLCRKWENSHISQKGKLNALLRASGLEWAFAPNMVLETVVHDGDRGPRVLMSDRKGRILADCKASKKTIENGLKRKFSSPWLVAQLLPLKRRTGKLSYILDLISRHGLLEKAIRPLTRFFFQFLKLKNKDFKGLYRSVLAVYSSKFKLGRNLRHSFASYGKPTLLGGDKSVPIGTARMPQWHWVERSSTGSCCKTWKAT